MKLTSYYILLPHNRIKVVLALPIGITLPSCNVSSNGLIVEVVFKCPQELLSFERDFGAQAHYNDPGMTYVYAERSLKLILPLMARLDAKNSIRMPSAVEVVPPISVSIPEHLQCSIVITLQQARGAFT